MAVPKLAKLLGKTGGGSMPEPPESSSEDMTEQAAEDESGGEEAEMGQELLDAFNAGDAAGLWRAFKDAVKACKY